MSFALSLPYDLVTKLWWRLLGFIINPTKKNKRLLCQRIIPPESSLPRDIIRDILCRLPAKTLVRFKAVSKLLRYLIQDPYFIKSHLKQSTDLRFVHNYYSRRDCSRKLITTYSAAGSLSEFSTHDFPAKKHRDCIKLLSSCNGLVCLIPARPGDIFPCRSRSRSFVGRVVALWNIATKECHIIKNPPRPFPQDPGCCFGFGYDSINDDYKVVRVECLPYPDKQSCDLHQIRVYSLRSDAWSEPIVYKAQHLQVENQTINSICELPHTKLLVHVENALHWVASGTDEHRYCILAFDLVKEELREVPALDILKKVRMKLGTLGGYLSSIGAASMVTKYDVWIMKDYMVKESWTKLFCIPLTDPYRHNSVLLWCAPVGYSWHGDKVLFFNKSGQFYWYSPEMNRVVKTFEFEFSTRGYDNVITCSLGSMVSIRAYRGTRHKPSAIATSFKKIWSLMF